MKGKFKIIVKNNRLHYEFEIKRNLTVIRGDSATGKTTLINMLRQAENLGPSSGIDVICNAPCRILEGSNWKLILENSSKTIFLPMKKMRLSIRKNLQLLSKNLTIITS